MLMLASVLRVTGVLTLLLVAADAGGQNLKVTLLGTGCPPPLMKRFGPSILVEAGEQKLLFDAGRGAMQRLWEIPVRWQDVNGVFLTHLHSDHVVGFPDLWLTGWTVPPGRKVPLRVWGPPGTRDMMAHLEQAYEFDLRIRALDDRLPREGAVLLVREVVEGVVYERDGVMVTAFEVDHAPVKPRLAVYSHIVSPIATEKDLIPQTRTTYSGPLELGEDMMVIEVGEVIRVRRKSSSKRPTLPRSMRPSCAAFSTPGAGARARTTRTPC